MMPSNVRKLLSLLVRKESRATAAASKKEAREEFTLILEYAGEGLLFPILGISIAASSTAEDLKELRAAAKEAAIHAHFHAGQHEPLAPAIRRAEDWRE